MSTETLPTELQEPVQEPVQKPEGPPTFLEVMQDAFSPMSCGIRQIIDVTPDVLTDLVNNQKMRLAFVLTGRGDSIAERLRAFVTPLRARASQDACGQLTKFAMDASRNHANDSIACTSPTHGSAIALIEAAHEFCIFLRWAYVRDGEFPFTKLLTIMDEHGLFPFLLLRGDLYVFRRVSTPLPCTP